TLLPICFHAPSPPQSYTLSLHDALPICMNVHELRDVITARFGAAGDADALNVTLVSFGYRNGIPANSDLVLDVRFLPNPYFVERSEEHTSELQSRGHLVCRLLLEKKKII